MFIVIFGARSTIPHQIRSHISRGVGWGGGERGNDITATAVREKDRERAKEKEGE